MAEVTEVTEVADVARTGHVVSRVVVGLAYVAAGLLVLVAQVEDVQLRWSVVAPLALLLLGLGLLVTGLVDTHLTRGGGRP